MKKKNSTKQALISSILVLALCCTMLVGTTFAWFTDSVTSSGNIIKSGNLKVDLELLDKGTSTWTSVKENSDPIFNYMKWEPGYTDAKVLRVENEGSLALKWKAKLVSEKQLTALADVIDVYVYAWGVLTNEEATGVNYPANRDLTANGYTRVGTLAEFANSIESTTYGVLQANEKAYLGIALKMQETAGNEYMNMDIGGAFNVQIVAAQLASEDDSFDPNYDDDAMYPVIPAFPVTTTEALLERLGNATDGEDIFVGAGEFEIPSTITITSAVNIYGAQMGVAPELWIDDPEAEKTVFKSNGSNVLEIRQYEEDPALATANVTIDGIMIDCDSNSVKGIYVKKSDGEAIEGVKITNCAIVNSTNDGIDVCNAYGAVIENNYIRNVKDTAIHLGNYNGYHYETWAEVTAYIRNNVIENVTATENGAIQLENGAGDVVVSGNVIKNVTAKTTTGSIKGAAIHVYDVYEGGEITIENNTIENVDFGISIYKYTYNTVCGEDWWEGPVTDNDIVRISTNTITDFKCHAIATSKLNAKGSSNLTLVDITGNTMTSTETNNVLSIEASGSVWSVTATGNTFNGASDNANGTFAP